MTQIAYDNTGAVITAAANGTPHYHNYAESGSWSATGDIDHDGYADDIVIERYNGSYSSYFCAYAYLQPEQTHWNLSLDSTFSWIGGEFLVGDLDGDGSYDDTLISTNPNTEDMTYALNESGGVLWTFPRGTTGPPLLLDFDHDGASDEVVLYAPTDQRIYAINENGVAIWNISYGGAAENYLAPGDLDHDGWEDEVIFQRYVEGVRRELVAVQEDGSIIWITRLPEAITYLTVKDLNGNGYRDNVLTSAWFIEASYALDSTGIVIGIGGISGGLTSFYVGDFDSNGVSDDFAISKSTGLHLLHLTPLVLSLAFAPSTPTEFTQRDTVTEFYANFSTPVSLPLSINFSSPTRFQAGSWGTVPAGNSTIATNLLLDPGTYTLTLTCLYKGIPLLTATHAITVHPASSIGIPSLSVIGTVLVLFIIIRFYKRRCSYNNTK